MPRQDKVFVCFQKAEDDTHKLYIYDDVTAYGTFNWSTWSYEEYMHKSVDMMRKGTVER